MAVPDGYSKAFLKAVESGQKVDCWFNPKEYSITKANNWDSKAIPGKDLPPTTQFGGGNPRELTLELMIDATDAEGGDVRTLTDRLFHLMDVDQSTASGRNDARPPMVEFGWGATATFKAVIKSLTVQFTLFRGNGIPIRATAKLNLTQAEKAIGKPAGKGGGGGGTPKKNNPTTMGLAGIRSHMILDGDTLQSISYAAYGDPTLWRRIAEANGIDDPLRLRRGSHLAIPRLTE